MQITVIMHKLSPS